MKNPSTSVSAKDISYLHDQFLMYGNPSSPYWFVGLEEGDAKKDHESIDQFVNRQLKKARKFESKSMLSLRDLCASGGSRFLPSMEQASVDKSIKAKYQTTWGGYIKLLLSVDRKMSGLATSWSSKDVIRYQTYYLGELEQHPNQPGSCLMELHPLARKGRKSSQWPYAQLAKREGMEFLESQGKYLNFASSRRTDSLLKNINRHAPEFVFCFGKNCREVLAGRFPCVVDTVKVQKNKKTVLIPVHLHNKSLVAFAPHPAARQLSDADWRQVGERIAELKLMQKTEQRVA